MKPALARMVARELAAALKATLQGHHAPDFPRNLAAVLGIGAMIVGALESYAEKPGADPFSKQLRGLVKTLRLGKLSQSKLERLLYPPLLKETVRADEFWLVIRFAHSVLEIPDVLKQTLQVAMADIGDSGKVGRTGALALGGAPAIAEYSAQLRSAAELLVHAKALSPHKTVMQLVDSLVEEHSQTACKLAQHLKAIESAFATAEYKKLKTSTSRAGFLADAMAGDQTVWLSGDQLKGLSATYAHQVAEEGRRILKPSQE